MQINLQEPLFQAAIPVLKQIESHGYEAYFVGGSIRDMLLGKVIGDIDIATSAFPAEIQTIFPKHFDVGIEHGTIVVLYQGNSYEITTFRTESTYSDYRRPDQVEFVRNLELDTLRRDFTINAMAVDARGNLYDYHGGFQDLQNKLLKAVGKPLERFQEDALRIMRGIRFASQLGFSLEDQTFSAMCQLAGNLSKISIERIRIELEKMMAGFYLGQTLKSFEQAKLAQTFPQAKTYDYLQGLVWLVERTPNHRGLSPCICWSLLLQGMKVTDSKKQIRLLKDWTLSNRLMNQVVDFLRLDDLLRQRKLDRESIYPFDQEVIDQMLNYLTINNELKFINQIHNLLANLPIRQRQDLAINGKQVMRILNMKKGGPIIGQLLDHVEGMVLRGEIENQTDQLSQWIAENK
ncbi:CCA tRNA nucleotidyltransferase [Facklamia miroungae]|uniref:CCA-adding enzyme n=1 Tax=Facklamia miroungae TaxID=120956 RepID=A0A1G7PN40_9LACT|nr:CCA tRNA nucleotidyltransferase [Facklamia miroungae]NKZ28749.1 CCA tRNA nucleotidyltransferase [Facklamia miroungae]SDF86800.1 tRNA nucleotidyltransferase (CCA-adding enzyme) [Facklamia miroungae]